MEAPLQGASWSGRQAQNQQDPHTAKASSRSQTGSLERLWDTSVPHPSVHPRVDALPRLLHQPSAYGQLTTKKRWWNLIAGDHKKRTASDSWTQWCWCLSGTGISPQSQIVAQVFAFETFFLFSGVNLAFLKSRTSLCHRNNKVPKR